MDLVRSWLVAVVVYFVGSFLFGALAINASDAQTLSTMAGAIWWTAAPLVLVYLAMVYLAAAAHSRRGNTARHAVAVLTVPAISMIGTAVFATSSMSGSYALMTAQIVCAIIGSAIGWLAVTPLRRRARDEVYYY